LDSRQEQEMFRFCQRSSSTQTKQASCSVDNKAVFPRVGGVGGKAAEARSLPLPFIKYGAQTVNGAEFILPYLPSCHSQ